MLLSASFHPAALGRALVLTLLLALVQLGALTHTLEHLKDLTGKSGASAETVCEWCAAYAQASHAAPCATASLPCPSFCAPPALVLCAACLRQTRFTAYLSQAPPMFS